MDLEGTMNLVFFDVVSIDGRLRVQAYPAGGMFEALAWVRGCVIPIDFCASVKAMVSTKGVGGCLGLYFLGGRWEPGATYSFREGLTPYLWGCDLSEIEEDFDGVETSTRIIVHDPATTARAARAALFKPGPLAPARVAQVAKSSQTITVRKGLPGVYVAAQGENNQLPRFTLTGPKGERITADGSTPDGPMLARNLIVGHDRRQGVSHVLIGAPSAGTWTLTPEPGSAPIQMVWSSEGLDKPKIKARVRGRGRPRVLHYTVPARRGQEVHFEERGATGKQMLGRARNGKGRLRFTSAASKAEKREIVAIVHQDGVLRDELVVASYKAPATRPPSRVGRVKLTRSGSRLVARWLPAIGARRYVVRVKLSSGRVVRKEVSRRNFSIRDVGRRVTGTVTVSGINELGRAGKAVKVKLKRPGKRKGRR
jgi:hypothetical protein